MEKRRFSIGWDALAFLVVFAAGWKFGLPADRWFDIPAFDEARYLHRGIELFRIGLTQLPSEWSPLYNLWYHLLYRFGTQDRIELYYLNFRLLGALLPALFFLVLRRYRVAFWAAFALAIYTVSTRLSWVIDTRVTSFALLLVFLGAWLLSFLPSGWPRMAVGALGMVVLAYARPEYLMAAGILGAFAILLGVSAWRRKEKAPSLSTVAVLVGIGLLAVTAWWLWGPPAGKGRSMYAFGQHFAYTRWYCLKQPKRGISWEDEIRADFGQAETIWQALVRNPSAFGSHVWCNLKTFPPRLGSTIFLHAAYFFPKGVLLEALLFTGLTGLAMFWMLLRHRKEWRSRWRTQRDAFLYWLAMALVGWTVLVVIHGAKRYYLIMLGWPIMVLGALLFLPQQSETQGKGRPRLGMLLAGLVLGIAVVPPMGYMTPYPWNPPYLENLELLKTIRSLALPEDRPIRWVSTRGLRHYFLMLYLPTEFEALPYAPEEGFLAYVQETQPDIITVDRRWFDGDSSWQAFLDAPEKYGYWVRSVGPYRWLFGRQDVIPPP